MDAGGGRLLQSFIQDELIEWLLQKLPPPGNANEDERKPH